MKNSFLLKVLLLSVLLCLISSPAYTLDYPHTTINNITCGSCHFVYGAESSLLIEGLNYGQNIDDTQYNALCWSCHNTIEAPYQRTHSSLQIDNDYGDWTVECKTCHDPHTQRQFKKHGNTLYEGVVDNVTTTMLTKAVDGVDWVADRYKDLVLIPEMIGTNKKYGYKILGNTVDTITVEGPIDLSKVDLGDTFAIIYGKLIKEKIKLDNIIGTVPPKTGYITTIFSDSTGPNSYADGDSVFDGICEVCHTKTDHFRNDGTGGDPLHVNMGLPAGTNCTDCHKHINGFAGMGGGAHPTHVIDNNGPQLLCSACHGSSTPPELANGQNLSNTTVCDNCHSAADAGTAKIYWLNDPGTWSATDGEAGFCGSCHDETPGNTDIGGSGIFAKNITGDQSTYGYFVTGHGKATGNFTRLSWQDISADGNPAANRGCGECHDLTTQHFDNSAQRLKTGFENDINNSNCNQCHTLGLGDDDPDWYTTYTAFENSAHSSKKCTDCHDVHGASGHFPGMVKVLEDQDMEQQDLCYQCHTDGIVVNNSISIWDPPYCWDTCSKRGSHTENDDQTILTDNNSGKPDWPVNSLVDQIIKNITDGSSGAITANTEKTITVALSGGTDNDWDLYDTYAFKNILTNDIEQAFISFGDGNKHSLGASYDIGSNSYTLECVSCHNVHLVTGKYSEADEDLSPVTRPSTPNNLTGNLTVWGDELGEKIDDYAGSGTYRTPKGDPFAGDELPDYNTFCRDCHEPMPDPTQAGSHGNLGYSNDDHGDRAANVPENDVCPQWYNCGKAVNWSSDNCTADDGGSSDSDCWPVIPKGRGEQIWTKSPYNQDERISPVVNFVMSCTDCHEAHGSSIQSMIRTSPNQGTGTTLWNTMCLNCHNFYSEFHQNQGSSLSCGNASCHGAQFSGNQRMTTTDTDTPHQNVYNGRDDTRVFDPDLVLDMRFEGNLVDSGSYNLAGVWSLNRPGATHHTAWCSGDSARQGTYETGMFGQAIDVNDQPVEVGTEDCDWSTAENKYNDTSETSGPGHFHVGHGTWKFTEMKYNMTLEAWVYPTDNTNERKIMAKHTYGSGGYAFVLEQIDGILRAELMTNINGGSGTDDCGGLRGAYSTTEIPLSEWTHVAATYDSTGLDRNDNDGSVGRVRIYVNGEDVTASSPDINSCYAQPGAGEDAMFPNSDHNILDPAGWYGSALSIGGLNWSDTFSNFIGRIDEVKVWNITKAASYFDDMIAPIITKVESVSGLNEIYVEFHEGVYGHDLLGDPVALTASDFSYGNVNVGGAGSISGVTHTAGESTAVITLNSELSVDDIDTDTLSVNSDSIYDEYDNAVSTDIWPITEIAGVPTITVVQGVDGHDRLAVWFSERVYETANATGTLQPADFDNLNLGKNIIGIDHEFGSPRATIILDAAISASDIDNVSVTLAAEGGSIYDITGNPAPINGVMLNEADVSSILKAEGVIGSNILKVTFESQVYANKDETGSLDKDDFTYGDGWNPGATGIQSVSHTPGSPVAIITLNNNLDANDINADTIAAASYSIFGPSRGNFPLDTGTVLITGQSAPTITKVEGAVGYDQVLVSFSEGVYTGTGRAGSLVAADFSYGNVYALGSTGINSVVHAAGNSTAIITLNSILDASDSATDTIAAAGSAIFNSANNPVGTAPAVAIEANDCTAWGVNFPIEDIPQNADWPVNPPADGEIEDETGLLSGPVFSPTISFPDVDNDVLNGDESQATGIKIINDDLCLISPRAFTIEARVKPTKVDNGTTNEFNRIVERRRTYMVTMLNTNYRGDDIAARSDRASIEVKYRVGSRHTCPNPQWPGDTTHTGNSVWMHQISSDIAQYPLHNDHWYLIRVVFNSDKSDLAGSNGTPVDIFIDDQGTDAHLYETNPNTGNPESNPDYEQWAGYKNATVSINGSSSCKWGSLPGDYNADFKTDNKFSIGTNWNNSSQGFDGKMDWVTWKPVAEYSGVDDSPR